MIEGRGRVDGSVALEVALVTPVLAVLLVGVLGLASVVIDQLVAERAARAIARAAAVSGHVGGMVEALPAGATVRSTRGSATVTVEVAISGDVVGVPYTVTAVAKAPREPALG